MNYLEERMILTMGACHTILLLFPPLMIQEMVWMLLDGPLMLRYYLVVL